MNTDQADVMMFDPMAFKVGDIVELDPEWFPKYANQAFKIVKINPKSVIVINENGLEAKTNRWSLMPSDRPFTQDENRPAIVLGTVVYMQRTAGQFVVIKNDIAGKANLVKLGGDGGKFYRGVPYAMLTVVPDDMVGVPSR